MVISCCCYGCDNTFVPGKVMTFFGFPKDKNIKDLWLKHIGMKDFVPTKNSRICIKHFTPDSYVFHKDRKIVFLNKDAVPTIFNLYNNKGGKKTQRQRPKKRSDDNEETNKDKEEFKPISKQCKTEVKIESTKILCRPPKNVEKIASSIKVEKVCVDEMKKEKPYVFDKRNVEKIASSIKVEKVCVDEIKKEKPYVFDKTDFVLEHMGPSYLPRVKCPKPPKVSLRKVKRYRYVLDFNEDEMQNPEKALRMLRMAKKKVQTQKAEIKVINEEATMLATKRTSLQKLLHKLVKINRNADTSANDFSLGKRMNFNSDVELDEHEVSDDDEDSCGSFTFKDNKNDEFMFEDEGSDNDQKIQSDKMSYGDVGSSDLKSNLETLEDDQYYIIQIIEKGDC